MTQTTTTTTTMTTMMWVLTLFIIVLTASIDLVAAYTGSKDVIAVTTGISGHEAKIPCEASSSVLDDRILLTIWYKDEALEPIYSFDARGRSVRHWVDVDVLGDKATFIPEAIPPYLHFSSIDASDAGVYICRVDYKRGPTYLAKINFTVTVPPESMIIMSDDDTVTYPGETIGPYDEGSTISITCEVSGGQPSPQVNWWRGRDDLLEFEVTKVDSNIVRSTVTIGPLGREDVDSFYICQASNNDEAGHLSATITVDVNLKPLSVQLLGSNTPMTAGKEYNISCQSVGGRPAASITWWLDGEELTNDTYIVEDLGNVTKNTISLTPEESWEGKSLMCLAESPVIVHEALEDSWELDIHYAPQVEMELSDEVDVENIEEGDNVTFVCRVKANPTVNEIQWYHERMELMANESGGVVIRNKKLKLHDITREQGGLYSCGANNDIGRGQSEPRVLAVQYSPVCSDMGKQVVGAAIKDKITMPCRVDASPGEVTFKWYHVMPDERTLLPNSFFTVEDRTSVITYEIRTEHDYGELLCYAANALGEQAIPCTFKVIRASKPDALDNCTLVNQTMDTINVMCLPGYDGGLPQQYIVRVFDLETRQMLRNMTEEVEPVFTLEGLPPGASFLLSISAENTKGESEQRTLHAFTLPSTTSTVPIVLNITPVLGVLIGVVGALVLVAIVVVVVMKLRGDARNAKMAKGSSGGAGAKVPHTPLHPAKDGEDGPDVILCRTDSTYEDVDGIPQKLKHANIYETVPYDSKDKNSKNSENDDKEDVEYAELTFTNGKNKSKGNKKSGANGAIRSSEESTIYATIDHTRTAQQEDVDPHSKKPQQQLGKQTQQNPGKQAQQKGNRNAQQDDQETPSKRNLDEIPLMDAALESSV